MTEKNVLKKVANELKELLNNIFKQNLIGFVEPKTEKQKVFIGVSNGDERVKVFSSFGNTLKTAFDNSCSKAIKSFSSDIIPKWIYMGFVESEEKQDIKEFNRTITETRRNYYRKGIAFDDFYQFSFLEQEVIGMALIKYSDTEARLHNENITYALRNKGLINRNYNFSEKHLKNIILFTCKGVFYDGEYHFLNNEGLNTGIRKNAEPNKEMLLSLVEKSAEYLKSTIKDDGSFVYGYFPSYAKVVPGYNTIRHCLSIMSFLDIYNLTKDTAYIEAIEETYSYYFKEFLFIISDDRAVIVDTANENEVRLGALGLSIITILQYAETFNKHDDIAVAIKLGNQIINMQNQENGQFVHVLNHPDLSIKDEFRIVYYSGEACYGLMRLYAFTKDERYLNCVKKAFNFFIDNHYENYNDHWLAYSVNELTKYELSDDYFIFGLKNVFQKIDFITERETTYATFLELLNASIQTVRRIQACGKDYLLEKYDVDKLHKAVLSRVRKQINGIFFPELAMFFKKPEEILYSVFIRHHTMRTRNDDVAHHLIGYCYFIENILPELLD